MYFLEQLKPFTAPNILGGHSCPVPTYRWKQIAVSEDKRALEELLNSTVKRRAKRENKSEYDVGREYKIVSNNPNDKND